MVDYTIFLLLLGQPGFDPDDLPSPQPPPFSPHVAPPPSSPPFPPGGDGGGAVEPRVEQWWARVADDGRDRRGFGGDHSTPRSENLKNSPSEWEFRAGDRGRSREIAGARTG